MNDTEFRTLLDEDEALVLGAPVVVHWTSCYRDYAARGVVTKVNRMSVRVRLEHVVLIDPGSAYPAGHQITVPRIADFRRWTAFNCARPDPTNAHPPTGEGTMTIDPNDTKRALVQIANGDRYIVEYASLWQHDECIGTRIIRAAGPIYYADLQPDGGPLEPGPDLFDRIDAFEPLSDEDAEWLQERDDTGELIYPIGAR